METFRNRNGAQNSRCTHLDTIHVGYFAGVELLCISFLSPHAMPGEVSILVWWEKCYRLSCHPMWTNSRQTRGENPLNIGPENSR